MGRTGLDWSACLCKTRFRDTEDEDKCVRTSDLSSS